jgi:Probable Zinc-ribbon domain
MDWICSEGHIWKAQVSSRKRAGCPFCAGQRLIVGINDLASKNPHVAAQLRSHDPQSIMAHSNIKCEWLCQEGHLWWAPASDRMAGNGCPYCSGREILVGFNDLKFKFPEIAIELVDGDPTEVTVGSGKRFYWKCKRDHIWLATVVSRTSGGGCPFCSNKKLLTGFNDLKTTNPKLSREAHGWDPSEVIAGSNARRYWICAKGHIFSASPNTRLRGDGCPYCSYHKVLEGFNDLATLYPRIAMEANGWDAKGMLAGSHQKVSWCCELGHVWIAQVKSRTISNGSNCPSCATSGFDPNAEGYLYLLHHIQWGMFKIGISNHFSKRTKEHESRGWDLLEIRGPLDGLLVQKWEQSILKMLENRGADLGREDIAGKFDGYTESWVAASFPVKSIHQLMSWVLDEER